MENDSKMQSNSRKQQCLGQILFDIQMDFQNFMIGVLQFKQQKVEFYRSMSEQEISQGQEPQIAGFVAKTFEILNNQEYSKIIFWGANGKEFIIKDINKFQEIVLPKYFRHKKINSFIRQLNMYGFHKSRKDNAKSIFSHPNFLKDREDLLSTIKRKIKCAEFFMKTPIKQRNNASEKKVQLTAVKQQETIKKIPQQASQAILRGFFQSRQFINSRFNLNVSIKRMSINEMGEEKPQPIDEEDKVSIQFGIENREEDFLDGPKILNPSLFFNSWKQPHSIIK